jgi:hypothetical protein
MNKKSTDVWQSVKVLVGKKGDYKKIDQFLLRFFKPMLGQYEDDFGLSKYIYTTYLKYPPENEIKDFGKRPYDMVIIRFSVPEEYFQPLTEQLKKDLDAARDAGEIVAFSIGNDWGPGNPECYSPFGGERVSDLIDDYLHQISRITLDLLERESELNLGEERPDVATPKMHDVTAQWAHILFRQMGVLDYPPQVTNNTIEIPEGGTLKILEPFRLDPEK